MRNPQTYILSAMILLLLGTGMEAAAQNKAKGLELNTICIDPGHGGHDAGCISRDGTKTMEKNIVLGIGLKLRDLLKEGYPGMKVVMTRSDDRFIQLGERAAIANRNNSGLFVSIHVNSVDPKNNRNWKSVTGFSVHCLGQSRTGSDLFTSNMNLVKRENSVILLEDDYTTTYQGFNPNDPESYIIFNLMQNSNLSQSLDFAEKVASKMDAEGPVAKNRGISQDPFLVLWKTTMPAVLIECGFITNSSDLEGMRSEAGQKKIAKAIYDAISDFKRNYDHSMTGSKTQARETEKTAPAAEKEAAPEAAEEAVPAGKVFYGVQVVASGHKMSPSDKFFKGYTPVEVAGRKYYKYILGASEDLGKAKENSKKIKAAFPGSFLVKVENGTTELVK